MSEKVIIALSGGVDSSVAAYLLQQQGYEVIGVTLDMGQEAEKIERVQAICKKLNLPFHRVDVKALFKKHVIDCFITEYQHGRTPNPCVPCNYFVKFNYLLKFAEKEFAANKLATGHYAQIKKDRKNIYHLYQAKNKAKDQSYFLHTLGQDILSRLIFPLGEVESKEEVRKIARKLRLPSAETEESQDVCFVKPEEFEQFFKKQKVRIKPGNIRKTSGEIVGQHRGIMFYTIGQRRGIGIADEKPLYVIRIEAKSNEVIVGYENELYSNSCSVEKVNLISGDFASKTFSCDVKIRYKTQPVPAEIKLKKDKKVEPFKRNPPKFHSGERRRATVHFSQPVKAVTCGQFAVFYDKGEVLGGGVIGA